VILKVAEKYLVLYKNPILFKWLSAVNVQCFAFNVQCFAFKCSMLRVQCSMLCVKGLILRALSLSKCNTFVVQGSNAFVVQGSNAFGVQGSNARMFKCSIVQRFKCSIARMFKCSLFKGSRFNWLGTELVEVQSLQRSYFYRLSIQGLRVL